MGSQRVGASATTRISRKDFGLTWNKLLESGGALVGDEVAISIDIEAIQKTAPAAGGEVELARHAGAKPAAR